MNKNPFKMIGPWIGLFLSLFIPIPFIFGSIMFLQIIKQFSFWFLLIPIIGFLIGWGIHSIYDHVSTKTGIIILISIFILLAIYSYSFFNVTTVYDTSQIDILGETYSYQSHVISERVCFMGCSEHIIYTLSNSDDKTTYNCIYFNINGGFGSYCEGKAGLNMGMNQLKVDQINQNRIAAGKSVIPVYTSCTQVKSVNRIIGMNLGC